MACLWLSLPAMAAIPVSDEALPAIIAAPGKVSEQPEMRGMQALGDDELGDIHGQALFFSDKIAPNALTGAITGGACGGGGCTPTDFTFYRMGLDGKLAMNMNISKLQLGCGGVNDALQFGVGCDIDVDYMSLMGRTGIRPTGYGDPASVAGVGSEVVLTRPYLEIAVKNDANPALREITGIKIGSAYVDGALGIGRFYGYNERNMENFNTQYTNSTVGAGDNNSPPPNGTGHCNPNAPFGNYQLSCHSGINSFSGFMGAEMSLALDVRARVNVLGVMIGLSGTGCVGRLSNPSGFNCSGSYPNTPVFVDYDGTRMDALLLSDAEVDFNGSGLASIMDAIYAQLFANLRLLHFATVDSSDFFLSLQREQVAWPSYGKVPLWQQVPAGNPQFDACGVGAARPARCNSAYAVTANTGWWMNIPVVKLLDVNPPEINFGDLSLAEALSLLGRPGLLVNNPRFDLLTTKNCYGGTSAKFC